ncbi:MAG: lipase class 3 [Pedosphaera sp.]|nr:lipase class 3 [Pedosphaera sp.]
MDLTFDTAATGFSPANARACAAASRLAYSEPPDVTGRQTDTQAIVRDCGNAIVVAFRGTTNVRDFITDAEAWRRNIEDCQIHSGFYRALVSINDELTAHIAGLPPRPLFITGHSLGGALAILFAFRLVLPPFPIHGVYTFGQPRVGNRNFAELYDRFQPANTFRFVNEQDIVPRVPGALSGYQHAGQEIFLPAVGGMKLNPPLWFKLLSDAWGTAREWKHGSIAQLADHHMDKYLFKVNAL